MLRILFVLLLVRSTIATTPTTGPFTPPLISTGSGAVFRAVYDNFCVNYTLDSVTFTADIPSLYNYTGLPWNQFISVGSGNPLSRLTTSTLDCSTLSDVPSLPTAIPVPYSAFVNGINAFNDFRFSQQTGTQDTYAPVNPNGVAPAVQIINDATTNYLTTMRFFFNINFAQIGQTCASLGSTYTTALEATTNPPSLLQYATELPMTAVARSSTNNLLINQANFAISHTIHDETIISVTGGVNYKLKTFLETAFLDSTNCSTGQTRLVIQFGMQYTSQNSSYLVQGARSPAGLSVLANCYNLTTRSVVRPPCIEGMCTSRVQIQTQCRTALGNGLTFANCMAGQSAADELTDVYFDSQGSYCPASSIDCVQSGTGFTMLYFTDKVRASMAFQTASRFLQVLEFYATPTKTLLQPLPGNYSLSVTDTIWAAVYFPYPDIQKNFNLTIDASSLFNITVFNAQGISLGSMSYSQMVHYGVITTGVKSTRAGVGGIQACDAVLGCDSFALNAAALFKAFPGGQSMTFNVSTLIPGGFNGQGTIGSYVRTSATQALTLNSVSTGANTSTTNTFYFGMAWVAAVGFVLVVGLAALIWSECGPRSARVAVEMSDM